MRIAGALSAFVLVTLAIACGGSGNVSISGAVDAAPTTDASGSCCAVTPGDDAGDAQVSQPTPDSGTPLPDASSGLDSGVDATTLNHACTPGISIACVGPGGCVTNQVCVADGSAFGPCVCASPGDATTLACVPGESIVCGGPGGCVSNQVCLADGSGYGACVCPDAGAARVDAGQDAATEWTPAMLPGLSLWLDDSRGMIVNPVQAGVVLHWLDSSGNGNLTTNTATVAQNGATELDPAVLNGHDAIRCSSAAPPACQVIADSPDLDFGAGDFGLVVVAKAVYGDYVYQSTDVTLTQDSNRNLVLSVGNQQLLLPNPSATDRFQIIAARGAALRLDVSGSTAAGPTNTVDAGASSVQLCFGSIDGAELAEVIAVKGTLSDADLARTQAYLKAKFAL